MKRLVGFGGLCVFLNLFGALSRGQAQAWAFSDEVTLGPSAAARAAAASFTDEASTIFEPALEPWIAPRLSLDGTMRFYASSNAQFDVVQIDVKNEGALPASEPYVAVEMLGESFGGTLYQYWGGTAIDPNTIEGGERGFVHVEVPRGGLQECRSYAVTLSLPEQGDALMGTIATQCPLRWTTPIDAQRLGATPDPLVLGKTLEDIVSSRVQGSAKGLCSSCHNRDAGTPPYYKPNVPRGATTLIEPFDDIGNHIGSPDGTASWAVGGTTSNGGSYYSWAEWFISRSDKPEGLKQVLKKWIADGFMH